MIERSVLIEDIQSMVPRRMYPALREFYANANFEIIASGPAKYGIDPYEIDWLHIFTPIEAAFWSDIRSSQLAMYPQYPVAGYFLDFACPAIKVCVECDGKSFHADREKDSKRDWRLAELGWTTYRMTGSECLAQPESELSPGELLLRKIYNGHVRQPEQAQDIHGQM